MWGVRAAAPGLTVAVALQSGFEPVPKHEDAVVVQRGPGRPADEPLSSRRSRRPVAWRAVADAVVLPLLWTVVVARDDRDGFTWIHINHTVTKADIGIYGVRRGPQKGLTVGAA